ncbi:MAG: hypothetical protein R2827_09430 [Bdellovibrionales bacterium]
MKSTTDRKNIRESLRRLETSAQKIIETRGYTKEVEKIQALTELIKEQFKNESINSTTRSIR